MAVPVGDYSVYSISVTSSYVNTVCLTIALWDAICTIPRELRCIWGRKWTLIKVLYLLSRYGPIIIFLVYAGFFLPPRPSDWSALQSSFDHSIFIYSILASIWMLIAEALLISRLWALWDGTRRATIWLSVGFATLVACSIVLGFSLRTWGLVAFSFISLSLFYLVMLMLTCIRAKRISALNVESSFVNTVMRDGILYYALLLSLSLTGLALPFARASTPTYLSQRVISLLSSIAACRMTLSLREAGSRTVVINGNITHPPRTRSGPMSALAFASNGRETDVELAIPTRDMAATTTAAIDTE